MTFAKIIAVGDGDWDADVRLAGVQLDSRSPWAEVVAELHGADFASCNSNTDTPWLTPTWELCVTRNDLHDPTSARDRYNVLWLKLSHVQLSSAAYGELNLSGVVIAAQAFPMSGETQVIPADAVCLDPKCSRARPGSPHWTSGSVMPEWRAPVGQAVKIALSPRWRDGRPAKPIPSLPSAAHEQGTPVESAPDANRPDATETTND